LLPARVILYQFYIAVFIVLARQDIGGIHLVRTKYMVGTDKVYRGYSKFTCIKKGRFYRIMADLQNIPFLVLSMN